MVRWRQAVPFGHFLPRVAFVLTATVQVGAVAACDPAAPPEPPRTGYSQWRCDAACAANDVEVVTLLQHIAEFFGSSQAQMRASMLLQHKMEYRSGSKPRRADPPEVPSFSVQWLLASGALGLALCLTFSVLVWNLRPACVHSGCIFAQILALTVKNVRVNLRTNLFGTRCCNVCCLQILGPVLLTALFTAVPDLVLQADGHPFREPHGFNQGLVALGGERLAVQRTTPADFRALVRHVSADTGVTGSGIAVSSVKDLALQWRRGAGSPPFSKDTPAPGPGAREGIKKALGDAFQVPAVAATVFAPSVMLITYFLIRERNSRQAELMKLVGLHDSARTISWLALFACVNLMVALGSATLIYSYVVQRSSFLLLVLMLFAYGMAATALGMAVSPLADTDRFGAAVSLGAHFAASLVCSGVPGSNSDSPIDDAHADSALWLYAASLLPPVAFVLCLKTYMAVDAAPGSLHITETFVTHQKQNIGAGVLVMALDVCIWGLLYLYLEQAARHDAGAGRPWYFPLTGRFWSDGAELEGDADAQRSPAAPDGDPPAEEREDGPLFEPEDAEELRALRRAHRVISVRRLRKAFHSAAGATVCAVDGLNLTMYEGECFCLLGHNGAGKSTAMGVITGMLSPTAGEVSVIGHRMPGEGTKVRHKIGLCMQQNVLWDTLTVEEHMQLFGGLMGLPQGDVASCCGRALEQVELTMKRTAQAVALSGGMQRKLNVALALLGDSPVIMLDEPTVGLDPRARHRLWARLRQSCAERVLCLATHHMDEAYGLEDRICVMARGRAACRGRSEFLRHNPSCAYVLSLVRGPGAGDDGTVLALVRRFCGAHNVAVVSAAGRELRLQLPFAAAGCLPALTHKLDAELAELGLERYGVRVSGLEDLLLRAASGEELGASSDGPAPLPRQVSAPHSPDGGIAPRQRRASTPLPTTGAPALFRRQVSAPLSAAGELAPFRRQASAPPSAVGEVEGAGAVEPLPPLPLLPQSTAAARQPRERPKPSLHRQFSALWLRRVCHGRRDAWMCCCQLVVPALTPAVFMALQGAIGHHRGEETAALLSGGALLVAYAFVPAGITAYVAMDQELGVKHQLMVSGTNRLAYWASNAAFDGALGLILLAASLVVFRFFGVAELVNARNLPATAVLLLLFTPAAAMHAYFLSLFFSSASGAAATVLTTCLIVGSFGVQISRILLAFKGARFSGHVILWATRILVPTVALSNGLSQLVTWKDASEAKGISPFSGTLFGNEFCFDVADLAAAAPTGAADLPCAYNTGDDAFALAVDALLYAALALLMEACSDRMAPLRDCGSKCPPGMRLQDEATVREERARVECFDPSEQALVLDDVYKTYDNNAYAVRGVSYAVEMGEVFGLLGANGAGKTTTLKMACGLLRPSAGRVLVRGMDVSQNLDRVRNLIGYCPQFNAFLDLLTVREHIELFARIKGFSELEVDGEVQKQMKRFDMAGFEHSLSCKLNGASARKLSVAVAMVGEPPLAFLDEPSAGMDPAARCSMWQAIRAIACRRGGGAIVLATHSAEEADALCSRIAIQASGQLRCLGTPQQLEARFGAVLELGLRLAVPSRGETAMLSAALLGTEAEAEALDEAAGAELLLARWRARQRAGAPPAGDCEKPPLPRKGASSGASLRALAEWCLLQERSECALRFLRHKYGHESVFIVDAAAGTLRLRLEGSDSLSGLPSFGEIFASLNQSQEHLCLADFQLSHSTLERAFNHIVAEDIERQVSESLSEAAATAAAPVAQTRP